MLQMQTLLVTLGGVVLSDMLADWRQNWNLIDDFQIKTAKMKASVFLGLVVSKRIISDRFHLDAVLRTMHAAVISIASKIQLPV